ncbi:MAG: hypothetical protein AB7S77_02710 [Desulfatirhabdiaceae bacterium]
MNQPYDIHAICCTCNNRSECQSMKNGIRQAIPILYCEEFDDVVDHLSIRSRQIRTVKPVSKERNFIGIIPLTGELKRVVRLCAWF